jgi:hypothetical protein
MQCYVATQSNGMLPLAAFPVQSYPAAECNQFCHPVQSNLPSRDNRTVRCGLPDTRQKSEGWTTPDTLRILAECIGDFSILDPARNG